MTDLQIQSAHPMHIVLIADDSRSLRGEPAQKVTEAIRAWLLELQTSARGKKEWFLFSLITFGTSPNLIVEAVSLNHVDAGKITIVGRSGTTNMAAALDLARSVIERAALPHHCPPFAFIYTDGRPYTDAPDVDDVDATLTAADSLKHLALPVDWEASGMTSPRLVTLGFGNVDDKLMRKIATCPKFYKRFHTADDLIESLPRLGTPTTRYGKATVKSYERQIEDLGEFGGELGEFGGEEDGQNI